MARVEAQHGTYMAITTTTTMTAEGLANLEAMLLLEQPFARLPFDELRRQQRTQQRLIEREMLFCASALKDPLPAADADKSIDAMLGRLRGLKRKLDPLSQQAAQTLRMAQSRTDHLAALHAVPSASSPEFADWSRTRLDRMLCDYMLRRGYTESAAHLADTKGIHDLVDTQLFDEMAKVEASLAGPQPTCALALAWCSENKTTLRKIKSPLEFDLRLQEFIELARVRTPESIKEAIAYARRHLLPLLVAPKVEAKKDDKDAEFDSLAQDAIRKQVSRAMGLLACGPSGWSYDDLYDPRRWLALRDNFRACALQIHSLPPQPILHVALSAGLASLKVPACYSHEARTTPAHLGGTTSESTATPPTRTVTVSTTLPPTLGPSQAETAYLGNAMSAAPPTLPPDSRNIDCPICDTEGLGTLAREVPWSHHEISALVCSVSGKPMDEHNTPLCLPNGRVYSQSALEEIAAKSKDGMTVTCPRTGDTCSFASLRKVYIS